MNLGSSNLYCLETNLKDIYIQPNNYAEQTLFSVSLGAT